MTVVILSSSNNNNSSNINSNNNGNMISSGAGLVRALREVEQGLHVGASGGERSGDSEDPEDPSYLEGIKGVSRNGGRK